ncbi:fumarylacetoacetate hydrolase family protein [Amycolatopsis jiangsuensis]|uniref:2-keto-4-pentenoate hydratase/2-oxohepta-3-ene-1,7-dioic acid hydratase in catechol pathway n=1 Tax=Amycolatopsis jiangsuensis TaxID=1181879 RepID=A0A840IMH7_9PSEU|nr:fumarylacetoacetate hydrolase family protein [Amycolatopsis jiangsuensis]MBB4683150.1 2-keto-4-pentenoate hydratase/2-oxohepta-3-ene-1,7-dioic acid hydratase in catechol pathway [Amycolatopsis jiangsuensis]
MTRWVDGYALGTFSDGSGEFPGLVSGERVLPLQEWETVRDLLEDWEAASTRLPELASTLAAGDGRSLAALSVRAPLRPRQILQAGANYRSHVAEIVLSGREPDDTRSDDEVRRDAEKMMDDKVRTGSPFLFSGLPAAICGPDDDVLLPAESAQVDWEAELTAVIGRTAHRVPRERALQHVAGFTVCNDISARDLQFPAEHRPLGGDWVRAKNRPTFLPTGPFITPITVLPDYRQLAITLDLNGERKQSDVAANLLFDVEALVAAASAATTLYPGDLVLTGSPAGNGGKWRRWLEPGDVLEAGISGIGVQRNTCVEEPR